MIVRICCETIDFSTTTQAIYINNWEAEVVQGVEYAGQGGLVFEASHQDGFNLPIGTYYFSDVDPFEPFGP